MSIDPQWLPPIAGLGMGAVIVVIWRIFEHGWAKDIARERQAAAEWDRTHPAE